MAGDRVKRTVEGREAIAMAKGMGFAVGEGDRTLYRWHFPIVGYLLRDF